MKITNEMIRHYFNRTDYESLRQNLATSVYNHKYLMEAFTWSSMETLLDREFGIELSMGFFAEIYDRGWHGPNIFISVQKRDMVRKIFIDSSVYDTVTNLNDLL